MYFCHMFRRRSKIYIAAEYMFDDVDVDVVVWLSSDN